MNELQAVIQRHSVRKYTSKPMESDVVAPLLKEIDAINKKLNSNIQLVLNTEGVFDTEYGRLKGVRNYIALVGKNSDNIEEVMGYYGERLVLLAQMLGLNTCWVVLTYNSDMVDIDIKNDETLVSLIAIGYGEHEGRQHLNKDVSEVSDLTDSDPEWYKSGVECATLAPTALNQQKFYISRSGDTVSITTNGDKYTYIDLGIVKYHFELGAGASNFKWQD